MKEQLLTNWHPMRWIALLIGFVMGINWLINAAPVSGFLALFFLFQAITNSGCLVGSCAPGVNTKSASSARLDDIEFEEIRSEK